MSEENTVVTKNESLTPEVKAQFHDPLMLRQGFYRDNYRLVSIVNILLVLGIIVVLAWIAYERTHKPLQEFYATTSDGKLVQLSPLNRPNLTTAALLDWVREATLTAYNFNFGNYAEVIKHMENYFTESGYENYLAALTSKKIIEEVRDKRLVVFAVPSGTPVILNEGPSPEGIYAWNVQIPILVTYQSAATQRKQNLVLNLLIARRPTLENAKGVGIAAFKVRER